MASAPKAIRPELPVQKLANVKVHYIGEPARHCSNCQHWEKERELCHNLIGKTIMRARAGDTCARGFYPDVERFPLADRYQGATT